MSNTAALRRSVLDLVRISQVNFQPKAVEALVSFAKTCPTSNTDSALKNVFSCLTELLSAEQATSNPSSSSAPTNNGRLVTESFVNSAVQRYYSISNIKPPQPTKSDVKSSLSQQTSTQQAAQNTQSRNAPGGQPAHTIVNQPTNITNHLQLIDAAHIPYSAVDPHSSTIALAQSSTVAAKASGFLRADRQFALTQRYWAALGRCHRSGLYMRGASGAASGAGAGSAGGFRMGVGQAEDSRPSLVPISSLEGLPDHVKTALLGILQYASLSEGSGSGASANLVGASGLASTAVGWRLEDPRATIPLIFDEEFSISEALQKLEHSNNHHDETDNATLGAADGDMPTISGGKRIGFVLKGACVVAIGKWTPEGYKVRRLELPPGETRETTLSAQNHIDTFGLAPHDPRSALETEKSATSDVIIFVSRAHLDNSSVHFKLSKMFGILKDHSEDDLEKMTFVFIGDFSSKAVALGDVSHAGSNTGPSAVTAANATTSVRGVVDPTLAYIQGREGFAALFTQLAATISAANAKVAQHSHFVFIPGPRDLTLLRGVLPQPPMPLDAVLGGFMKKCPHTVSASNPCRLRFHTKEIVIARSDFYQSLRAESFATATATPKTATGIGSNKGAVIDLDEENDTANDKPKEQPFEHVVKTIIDNAHLFPAIPSSFAMPSSSSSSNSNPMATFQAPGLNNNAAATAPTNLSKLNATTSATVATLASTTGSQVMQRSIIWAQDHALRLSPLPHYLLLCDQTAEWSCTYRGCKVLNPGSFSSTSSFVWFEPAEGNITFNTI